MFTSFANYSYSYFVAYDLYIIFIALTIPDSIWIPFLTSPNPPL